MCERFTPDDARQNICPFISSQTAKEKCISDGHGLDHGPCMKWRVLLRRNPDMDTNGWGYCGALEEQ